MDMQDLGAKLDLVLAQQRTLIEQQQALLDRQAILDCVTAYTRGLDRLDAELIVSAYHPDAMDDHGMIVAGPGPFAEWAVDMHRRDTAGTLHYQATHSCEIDGDVAHAETYWLGAVRHGGGEGLTFAGGRWLDRLERRGGQWKIVVRKCIPEWSGTPLLQPMNEISRELQKLSPRPARDRTDPSYERPLTIDPARAALAAR
jgi:hypothetical protein